MGAYLGLVLAGGQSQRMGTNKAELRLPSGRTFLSHSADLLAKVAPRVVVSSRKQYAGFECIRDVAGPCGPARGVAAGLKLAAEMNWDGIITLPCDVPNMQGKLLQELVEFHRNNSAWASCYVNGLTERIEMLIGVYDVELLNPLLEGLGRGVASLFQLIPAEHRACLPYGQDISSFFHNCNCPQDLDLPGGVVI